MELAAREGTCLPTRGSEKRLLAGEERPVLKKDKSLVGRILSAAPRGRSPGRGKKGGSGVQEKIV